ncbi:MAG: succinate dehydrogenase flavoprotein subunit [Candidatus Nitrohelix vancouverensis]|uniref:succinate dehydrogenase n=1 Tax=Candidatus Nitrohelix vancouverensis TaxID=2705534 RepID=A0A7T0G4Q6_9BACT|nr:MAG: succinate dehydrogenase flavoprotein subunit [Candidatus Nitrohelix vancouverensis]
MPRRKKKIIIIGGGLAGLSAAMKLCERDAEVVIVSFQNLKRSHSVCAQGGINAAIDAKNEGDTPEKHFYDTIKGGDFLAHQPLVRDMCHQAPAIIHLLDRIGVAFNRTGEGRLAFRRFGGTLYSRTAFAGATTGQQLVYSLDEQVRRFEHDGMVERLEWHEYLGAVIDDEGVCRGAVLHDLHTNKLFTVKGDAVILATGGPGQVYVRSTNSVVNTGAAATQAYLQGAKYGNGEFIQIHPTAIPGQDKLRLMSESARGEGGRVWVPRRADDKRDPKSIPESERYYFLEEKYPLYGNLVPRDVASREIYDIVYNHRLGVGGEPMVFLDLTHKSKAYLEDRLGGILDIYQKFTGDDPKITPMRIFPAVHYSMGGLWTDFERDSHGLIDHASPRNQSTSIPGLYAAGEADYQYHGANRLGANSLLSCIYTGLMMSRAVINFSNNLNRSFEDVPSTVYEQTQSYWENRFRDIRKMDGSENPYQLHKELGDTMMSSVLIVRDNKTLEKTQHAIEDIETRFKDVKCVDTSNWANPTPSFINQLYCMIHLSKIIAKGALMRDEFRGAHYKPDFDLRQPGDFDPFEYIDYLERKKNGEAMEDSHYPEGHLDYMKRFEENNKKWLKSSIATYKDNGPEITYEDVDTSIVTPRPRKYD